MNDCRNIMYITTTHNPNTNRRNTITCWIINNIVCRIITSVYWHFTKWTVVTSQPNFNPAGMDPKWKTNSQSVTTGLGAKEHPHCSQEMFKFQLVLSVSTFWSRWGQKHHHLRRWKINEPLIWRGSKMNSPINDTVAECLFIGQRSIHIALEDIFESQSVSSISAFCLRVGTHHQAINEPALKQNRSCCHLRWWKINEPLKV
jgi:hypothetical protein